MKKLIRITAVTCAALWVAGAAVADCYADYKAKRDNPLQLHYGVIELPQQACASTGAAQDLIATRIAVDDWTLLNVLDIFGEDGLAERRESAGRYFLRY